MPGTTRSMLKVGDVMTREPACVQPATTIRELARLLEEWEISGAPVVDAEGRLVGVVSRADLIRRWLDEGDQRTAISLVELLGLESDEEEAGIKPERLIVVEDFMSTEPITARAEEPLAEVARRMAEARVHRVIVVDEDGTPEGIVTSLDLLRFWQA